MQAKVSAHGGPRPIAISPRRSRWRLVCLAWCAGVLSWGSPQLVSAAPVLSQVPIRGLQIGGTTTLEFQGSGLSPNPRILGSRLPIAEQKVLEGSTADRALIQVTLGSDVAAGFYSVRLATEEGISAAVVVGVDRLPEQAFAAELPQLPVALHGSVSGGQRLRTRFQGRGGQQLVVDLEAARLGSALNPVVRLYDAEGTQLAWSGPRSALGGDARFRFVLPADGSYDVELHDLVYRAKTPGFFRLKMGELLTPDLAFPLGIRLGESATVQYLLQGQVLGEGTVDAASLLAVGVQPALVPSDRLWTGGGPQVYLSPYRELVADEASQPQPLGSAPVAVSGRLLEPGQQDRYLVDVQPGDRLHCELYSHRLGTAIDGVLVVRVPGGAELGRNDDHGQTSDPALDVAVPAGVNQVEILVQDLLRGGGPGEVYRLAVEPAGAADFRLLLDQAELQVPAGGAQVLPVQVVRRQYGGPVRVQLQGGPEDLEVVGNEIPAGRDRGLLLVRRTSGSPWAASLQLTGTAELEGHSLVRTATTSASDVTRQFPWLGTSLGAASAPAAPVSVAWLPQMAKLPVFRGMPYPIQVRVERREGITSALRLRLVTNQLVPQKTVQQDGKDQQVDDVERALRLESPVVVDAMATRAEAALYIPPDLPPGPWDVVLVADQLAEDGEQVLATVASSWFRLEASDPLQLTLESPGEEDRPAAVVPGRVVTLKGQVQRLGGFLYPVTVQVEGKAEGWPEGFTLPKVEVPVDQETFELTLELPAEIPAAQGEGLRLVATAQPRESAPPVRSNAISLSR